PTDPTPQPTPLSTPAARYQGSIDLLVFRVDAGRSEVAVPLGHPLALPLREGDHVKVVAEVAPAAYLYVFWIDEAGTGYPMYPWVPTQWGTRPAAEGPVSRRELKDAKGNWFQISGDASG